MTVPIPENVFAAVQKCVAESLALEPSEVRLESRLIDDFGADSLDFVDIVFTLEQVLDVKMRESELNFLTRLDFSSPEVMQGGYLTPAVVDKLEAWLPGVTTVPDRARITPRGLFSLISVEAICLAATLRLAART